MITCKHCGAENRDDYVYCLMCGKPLKEREKAPAKGLSVKADRRIIIAAAAALAVLVLAILFWPKGKVSSFTLYETRPFVRNTDTGVTVVSVGHKPTPVLAGKSSQIAYSFDRSRLAFVNIVDGSHILCAYNGKELKETVSDVDSFLLSSSGEFACYNADSDDSWYYLNLKNGKSVQFIDGTQNDNHAIAMSISGKTMAYVTTDSLTTMHVIKDGSSKAASFETERVDHIVNVADDGTVLFLNNDGELCSAKNGKTEKLASAVSSIFINSDGSEFAFVEDGQYKLIRNGKILTSESEHTGRISSLIYPETMASSSSRAYVNRSYIYIYHYGVSSFTDKYYATSDGEIIRVDSKLNAEVIASSAPQTLISNDGSRLVYTDDFGNIFIHDGRDAVELLTEENKASTLFAYDSVHDGVYYRGSANYITYADRKTNTPFFRPGTYMNTCCDDGYFYFKSSYTIYGTVKGSEPVEIDRAYSSGKASNDDYSHYGILYYSNEQNYYFLKNGTRVPVESEPQ
ncbi:MAG: zinc ribbon domain-containing protein [Erysipelotrichaceae bacterium]|nr:zinc ribbon domain-containing protein [Erysipelotrichaceae bacterium]